MATYKKRGHKPKGKKEEQLVEEANSTTAEVFSSLDEGASKTEAWVSKNQNYILGVIGAITLGVLGYLAYGQFVQQPKEAEASNELYYPQQYFEQAMQDEAKKDSLLNLALLGAEGKYGFLDIMEDYSGTKAANLSTYAAGMAYLNLKNYKEAIGYLEGFSSDDAILGALAKGGIGDAFSQLDQPEDALEYYEMAVAHDDNSYTTPMYLHKAGVIAMKLGDKAKALIHFKRIEEEFKDSKQGNGIEALIGMAQN